VSSSYQHGRDRRNPGSDINDNPFAKPAVGAVKTCIGNISNGIPVDDLAEFLRDKGDHSLTHQAEMVRQKFNCSAEDLPWLQLAVEINRAARHNLAFDLLDVLTETIQRDPTGTLAISPIASELCMVAAARR